MYDPITELDRIQGKYLEILEKTNLSLFPDFKAEQILFNETSYCIKLRRTDVLKAVIKSLLFKSYSLDYEISNQEVLLLYSKNYRSDHDGYWQKIKDDVQNSDNVTILTQGQRKLELKNLPGKVKALITCYKDLNKIDDKKDRLYLALRLVDRNLVMCEFDQLKLTPKVVMCFSDNSADENVLMPYFKAKGAITITNQHGLCIFQSYNYDRLNQSQILNFKSDYFFARSEKQKEQFILAGFDSKRIRVVGFIDGENNDINNTDNEVIGIYLDCPTLPLADENNSRMLKFAIQIAKALGWKYLVKCHPQDTIDNYKNDVDDECIGIFGKGTELNETFEKAGIGIIHASATYVDAYTYGLRCLKMNSEIRYPIAVKDDEFDTLDQAIDKVVAWTKKTNEEKKDYIQLVRKQYSSPWISGNIDRELKKIITEKVFDKVAKAL